MRIILKLYIVSLVALAVPTQARASACQKLLERTKAAAVSTVLDVMAAVSGLPKYMKKVEERNKNASCEGL